jgi:protein-tyrosine phosphatase
MKHLLNKERLAEKIKVDSAGTIAYHEGEAPDPRMKKHAAKRGYQLASIARKFDPAKDFEAFDYIVAMDNENYFNLISQDKENKYLHKIFKMTDFCSNNFAEEVPDPYYGGPAGFENVLDILEDAAQGLLEKVKQDASE